MSFLSQLISELSVARRNAKPLSCNPPRCLNSVCLCAFVIKHARHTSYTNAYQVPNRAGLVSPFARSYLSFFVLFCFVCWCFCLFVLGFFLMLKWMVRCDAECVCLTCFRLIQSWVCYFSELAWSGFWSVLASCLCPSLRLHCVSSLLLTQGNHITVASNFSIFTHLCSHVPFFFFFESYSKAKIVISRELLQSPRNLASSRAHSPQPGPQPHGAGTAPAPQPRLPPPVLREGTGCNRNLAGHYKTF